MGYDKLLEIRLRDLFADIEEYTEKKMFGGIAFLIKGNMSCGIHKDNIVVRVGPENYDELLKQPIAKEFNVTGRSMRGWIMIHSKDLEKDEILERWVSLGIQFAKSLPAK